jgi:carboxymethylenebutenolidase
MKRPLLAVVLVAFLSTTVAVGEPETPKLMAEQWLGILSEEEFKELHELRSDETPPLHGEMIELAGGVAYLSLPEGEGPHPGVLVIQEWWGLNDNIKYWSDRLAADGYAALAVDLYEGTVATTRDGAYAAMQAVEDDRAYEVIRAGLDHLKNEAGTSGLGCIGWCFGGGWSLNTALANPDVTACVIYYGRLTDDVAALSQITGPVCGVFGNQDQGIPPETVDKFAAALDEAGVPHEIHRYDANHAFANPSSARYDEEAASDAWVKARAFLAANLKEE